MNKRSIWKTLAMGLLFFNLVFTAFSGQPVSSEADEESLTMQKMGFSSNLPLGPGSNIFGGGSLTLLADDGNRQMLSMIMQAKDGTLIVIDGGWSSNSGHLLDVIKSRGGHVSGWFITHAHSDHAGAIIEILNNPNNGITIDNVYYSLPDQTWYDTVEAGRADFVKSLRDALAKLPPDKNHSNLTKGQEIQLGEIKVKILNIPYLLDATSVNNSSVVYKVYINNISTLILGDLGPEGGQLLMNDNTMEELRSDIVQMAHHGQYGVNRDVYAAINAQIALWPCPLWLWNDDNGGGTGSGDWKTLETRKWMDELGIRANYCIKDGDQVIY